MDDPPAANVDSVLSLERVLAEGSALLHLTVDGEGRIRSMNPALVARIAREPPAGSPLEDVLVPEAAGTVERWLGSDPLPEERRPLLHFRGPDEERFSLECWVARHDGFLHIVGEEPAERKATAAELMQMNADLTVMKRELARKNRELTETRRELTETLGDLRNSYWHLEKVQDILPMCMRCRRIRTDETSWADVVDYFRENDILFSHGLCPQCEEEFLEEADEVFPPPSEDDG